MRKLRVVDIDSSRSWSEWVLSMGIIAMMCVGMWVTLGAIGHWFEIAVKHNPHHLFGG